MTPPVFRTAVVIALNLVGLEQLGGVGLSDYGVGLQHVCVTASADDAHEAPVV